jgi:hypothetical protein
MDFLHDIIGNNIMLECGGFEGNPEMLAKYIDNQTVELPLIAPGLVYNRGAGLIWRWKLSGYCWLVRWHALRASRYLCWEAGCSHMGP